MTDEMRAYFAQVFDKDENIVAVGRGEGDKTLVFVTDDTPEVLAPYATRAPGVQFIRTQGFYAYQIPTGRFRPAPGGVSCGSIHITGGTLGCAVRDKKTGELGILTCNHVACPNLDGPVGERIVQPGPIHGGAATDTIARLVRWTDLKTSVTRDSDSAYARADNQTLEADISLNQLNIGYVHGSAEPYLGEFIYKMGARTDITKGWITAVDVKARISYGPGLDISLDELFVSNCFSMPGDSGSLMLDFGGNMAIGLLFAGDGIYTIGCKMSIAERRLEVEPYPPPEIMRRKILDVSHWQGSIDANKMREMGISGLMMKATQRGDWRDGKFHQFYDQATQAGLLRGAYIYVEPRYSANDHWQNFLGHLGGRELEMPIALDCEDEAGQDARTVTAVIQQLSNLITAHQEGRRPLIYTSPGWWNNNVLDWSEWKNHPLWIANWTQFGTAPLLPKDWTSLEQAAMWQYYVEENGPALGVESQRIDVNRSYRLFEKIISGGETPPPDTVTLTISIEGEGFVLPSGGTYPTGEVLQLQATPEDGWCFVGWSGDAEGQENPLTVTMSVSKYIIATFEREEGGGGGPAEFTHYQGVTQVRGQNIRRLPTTVNNTPVGVLDAGQTIRLFEFVKDAQGNDWANIGWDYTRKCNLYAAILHNGTEYIKVIQDE